jgi:hypothetical protein
VPAQPLFLGWFFFCFGEMKTVHPKQRNFFFNPKRLGFASPTLVRYLYTSRNNITPMPFPTRLDFRYKREAILVIFFFFSFFLPKSIVQKKKKKKKKKNKPLRRACVGRFWPSISFFSSKNTQKKIETKS